MSHLQETPGQIHNSLEGLNDLNDPPWPENTLESVSGEGLVYLLDLVPKTCCTGGRKWRWRLLLESVGKIS